MSADRTDTPGSPAARILLTLRNKVGLHARPAGEFVRVARGFKSSVRITCGGKEADGKNLMSVLSLEAAQGSLLVVEANGEDSRAAVKALYTLVLSKFADLE
jgi:phosphocarrier protein